MQMRKNRKTALTILCTAFITAATVFLGACGLAITDSDNNISATAAENVGSANTQAADENVRSIDTQAVDEDLGSTGSPTEETQASNENATETANTNIDEKTDKNILGTGNTVFDLTVADKDGNETYFEIHTDKETVGEALIELGLIEGDEGEYGLYIKKVNGITADYDKDGVYWAFYVNGEYASSGVDLTKITEGESYALKVE